MQNQSIARLLVSLASVVVIIAGLKVSADILGQVLVSLFITLACAPIVEWLRRKGVPNFIALTIVVLAVVAAGLVLMSFLGLSITQLTAALPTYRSLIESQVNSLVQFLDSKGFEAADIAKLDMFQPGKMIEVIVSFIRGLLGTVTNVGLTLFIFIYMLAGAASFSKKLNRGLGMDSPMLIRLNVFSRSISTYLLIKSWLGAVTAVCHIIFLWVMGVNFAVLWGVISFLFNFIPNIGFIISLIPPVLMALLEFGLGKAVVVLVGYILINNFFDMVVGPRYLGKGLDLSTLVTFLAVIFWAWVLGPVGAFLALPLTVLLKKVALESYEDSELLAKLMGADEDDGAI